MMDNSKNINGDFTGNVFKVAVHSRGDRYFAAITDGLTDVQIIKVDGFDNTSSFEHFVSSALQDKKIDLLLTDISSLPYPLPQTLVVVAVVNGLFNTIKHNEIDDFGVLIALSDRADLIHPFEKIDERNKWGDVSLAGFGPGDPGLITHRTEELLSLADIIFYDDLIDDNYLDKFNAQKVYVGKRKGQHSHVQGDINQLLCEAAISGKKVVRLKGGDPLIFGRGAEEFHYLQQRLVKASIISGISSAMAAAAAIQVPLTARGISSSVVFLSAHDLMKLNIPKAETLVFFMGATRQCELAQLLIDKGWHTQTPVAVVKNASLPNCENRRYNIIEMLNDANPLSGPAIIIVGYVAAFNPEDQPPRWLYTGIHLDDFNEHGIPVHSPMNEILPVEATPELEKTLRNINRFDRIIFTSRHAVRTFFDRLFDVGLDVRALGAISITSIGKTTSSELKIKGLLVDPAGTNESIEGIIDMFKSTGITNESILIPGSLQSRSPLYRQLEQIGNRVMRLPVFRSEMPDHIIRHNLDEFKGVIFTSPSTVDHFVKFYSFIPPNLVIKVRGRQTAIRLKEYYSQNEFEVIK